MKNLELLILIGPPGSGKGTLAAALAQSNGYHPVSTGELLRQAARTDPVLGEQLALGTLTPDATIGTLLTRAISGHKKVLLDGYPRTLTQVWHLATLFPDASIRALSLDVPDELSLERTAKRAAQTTAAERRPEDAPSVARTRLDLFHAQTAVVLQAYATQRSRGPEQLRIYDPERGDTYKMQGVLSTLDGRGSPEQVHLAAQHALQHAPAGYRDRNAYTRRFLSKFAARLRRTERRMTHEPHHFRDRPERAKLSQQQQAVFLRQGILKVGRHKTPLAQGELVRRRRGLFNGRWPTATILSVTDGTLATVDCGDGVAAQYPLTELKRA